MPKKLILTIVALFLVSFCLNGDCSGKGIFESTTSWVVPADYRYKDRTRAFNDVASCATLSTTDTENQVCCYIKVKFENENNDEKYTHKGCYEVDVHYMTDNDAYDIDNLIDFIEASFDANNTNYKLVSKSISLDCSSKYLQLAGLAVLILLL